jgi:Peptidase family S41/PDZ domain
MNRLFAIALVVCAGQGAFANLTTDEKVSDFLQLAALYARNYGPYEEKIDLIGFDLYNVQPWVDQVTASTSDLQFYDICTKYVASLQDSHDEFTINSDYDAFLPITADVYDGKVLIDFIDRTQLPSRLFPFQVGDELVSVDGTTMANWIKQLQPYAVNGSANAVSRNRLAVATVLERYQPWFALAPTTIPAGKMSTIVVNRQAGAQGTYMIPWQIDGTAILGEGPIPPLQGKVATQSAMRFNLRRGGGPQSPQETPNPWGLWTGPRPAMQPDPIPVYMQTLHKLATDRPVDGPRLEGGLSPFGNIVPVFDPPANFKLRLGFGSSDQFLSGTYTSQGKTIGYIRIPTMEPPSESVALNQFLGEIRFFQTNTDGLVVDIMANGGGDGCYSQTLASLLIPAPFRGLNQEIRATEAWVADFSFSVTEAQLEGAPQWVVNLYSSYLAAVKQAFSENRGLTGSLPLCSATELQGPATDTKGNNLAYTKPILVLTDNYTLSAAEIFAMFLQDSGRAKLFGTLTDGGGGNVVSFDAGAFSEGQTRVTLGLITRASAEGTPGFPADPNNRSFYDGIGITPDIAGDFMTKDNLLNFGSTFVANFTAAILNSITPPGK